jgi:16S rRNA (cytosine967-C5)-methyltransferase
MWLRINRSHSDQHEITGRLEDADFKLATQPFAADALCITPAAKVNDIPGFQEGLLSVQDPAAQLAVDLLELDSQHHVLDACAAPGGKTCHILERYPSVEMSAVELSRSRLDLVRENVERLGFGQHAGLKLIAGDAAETTDWWDGKLFDRILLDAPCTATGVIRRHPEIKWLRNRAQLEEAIRLQERLLRQLWPLLQVGGILVYATCSVLKDENSKQINAFLASHDDSEALPMAVTWGHDLGCGRQILPGEAGMDGFFYARLRKVF